MAENNSSAPLKTAEGAATRWCVHVTGADDVHPMPSREVALEEANALNTSICRIKRQDVDPVLIAVVAEWPHSADSHAAGLMIRDECLRMRGTQAVAAQAPAAVAVPDEDMQDLVSKALRKAWQLGQTYWQQADSDYISQQKKSDATQAKFQDLIDETRAALAATPALPALPATEDSSAGDVAALIKKFRAVLTAEIHASIDPSSDIARQEGAIDTADHLLAEFNKIFPEA